MMIKPSSSLAFALLLLLSSSASIFGGARTEPLRTVFDLNSLNSVIGKREANGLTTTVGCLSDANFDSVSHQLPKTIDEGGPVVKVVVSHEIDLEALVINGTLSVGLVSGEPSATAVEEGLLYPFSTQSVSPRAALFAESSDLLQAWNAAWTRVVSSGEWYALHERNRPFESVAVFDCPIDNEVMAFPPTVVATTTGNNDDNSDDGGDDNSIISPSPSLLERVLDTGELRIVGLGPFNWGIDGNYEDDTGFLPEYAAAIVREMSKGLKQTIRIKRVWAGSSDEVLDKLRDGDADLTDLYMILAAPYNGEPRTRTFHSSCITLGYEGTFFVAGELAEIIPLA